MDRWIRAPLGELTSKIGSGATPLGGEMAYQAEGVSLIRSLNVHDCAFRRKDLAHLSGQQADGLANVVVQSDDVLLNITGASIARCCLAPDDVLPARVNQHVAIIRPFSDRLLPRFLQYLLVSGMYKDRLLSTGEGAGSTRQALTKAQLQNFIVEFPEALHEQARIVAILDEVFEGIATAKTNAEKNLRGARELFESHVKSTFGNPTDGWVECALGSICEMYQPRTITAKDLVADGPYPVYGANGVIGRFTAFNHEEAEVLVTCRGATCGAINVSEPRSWVTGNAMVVRPLDGNLDKAFLEHLLRNGVDLSPAITGAAQPQITRTNLSPLKISFPKSVDEQRSLTSSFDELQAMTVSLQDVHSRKLTALDELKNSLLHQAFTGAL